MSFLDKLKAMFSGGSSTTEHDHHDHSHEGHDHSHGDHDHSHDPIDDVPAAPAAPMDPLGTTEPEPMAGEHDRSA
jgi:hypothetical protein